MVFEMAEATGASFTAVTIERDRGRSRQGCSIRDAEVNESAPLYSAAGV